MILDFHLSRCVQHNCKYDITIVNLLMNSSKIQHYNTVLILFQQYNVIYSDFEKVIVIIQTIDNIIICECGWECLHINIM